MIKGDLVLKVKRSNELLEFMPETICYILHEICIRKRRSNGSERVRETLGMKKVVHHSLSSKFLQLTELITKSFDV